MCLVYESTRGSPRSTCSTTCSVRWRPRGPRGPYRSSRATRCPSSSSAAAPMRRPCRCRSSCPPPLPGRCRTMRWGGTVRRTVSLRTCCRAADSSASTDPVAASRGSIATHTPSLPRRGRVCDRGLPYFVGAGGRVAPVGVADVRVPDGQWTSSDAGLAGFRRRRGRGRNAIVRGLVLERAIEEARHLAAPQAAAVAVCWPRFRNFWWLRLPSPVGTRPPRR